MTITPHIVVHDASAASKWYERAFGAVERDRLPLPNGKVMYVELWFGDSPVRIADEFPAVGILSPLTIGGTAVVLHLSTDDVDSLWQRALDGGAKVLAPLAEQFWGDRQGQLLDPFGHKWGLAQHVRDVSREEIAAAAAAMFAGDAPEHGA
jgi:PhnB protein